MPLLADECVLDVRLAKPQTPGLFLTGSGKANRRTKRGIKKLTGMELFNALAAPLQAKSAQPGALSGMRGYRRCMSGEARPIVAEWSAVLTVDD